MSRVYGFGYCLGFRVWALGFGVKGLGFRVDGSSQKRKSDICRKGCISHDK